jgi:HlyD family secretion protein
MTPPSPDTIGETLGLDDAGRRKRAVGRWVLGVVVLLAVGAAGAAYLWLGGDGGAPRYVTAAVERGDLAVTVTATGTLEPTNEVDVSSELSGIVRSVRVDHNDAVKQGQTLAELDTDKLKAQVALSEAELVAARARVKEATATVTQTKRDFDRYKPLAESSVVSAQKFDEAEAAYARANAGLESARADVAVAEANLQLRRTDLEKACICSPIDGVVLQRAVEPGQTVAATLQAPVLFTVAEDLTEMELQVDVDEADVSLVAAGQSAHFTVDAYPDRDFPATVTKVRYAPETTEGVVTYKAQLTADNGELLLRPGMTATAEIAVQTVRDAVLVPNEALRFTPPQTEAESDDGGGFLRQLLPRPPHRTTTRQPAAATGNQRTLWVLRDGAPAAVAVTIGLSDGQRTAIVDGDLAPGQAVIIDTQDTAS